MDYCLREPATKTKGQEEQKIENLTTSDLNLIIILAFNILKLAVVKTFD